MKNTTFLIMITAIKTTKVVINIYARLHVACLQRPDASGRYFGVNQLWPWTEILPKVKEICPEYKMPQVLQLPIQ